MALPPQFTPIEQLDRYYWLSFTNPDLPEGHRFLGVSIVHVTVTDVRVAELNLLPSKSDQRNSDLMWIRAAIQASWDRQCNPGGEVMSVQVFLKDLPSETPIFHLMLLDELYLRGLIKRDAPYAQYEN